MEIPKEINIGILIADESSPLNSKVDVYNLASLKQLFSLRKYFKILTIRQRCIPNVPNSIKSSLEDWSFLRNLELILLIGGASLTYWASEEVKSIIQKHTALSSLCSLNVSKYSSSCVSPRCCVLGKTLILMLPSNVLDWEPTLQKFVQAISSAFEEIKNEDRSISFSFGPHQDNFWNQNFKSEVKISKVAERPRKSLYEMISVDKAVEIILHESVPLHTVHKSVTDCFSFVIAEDVIAEEPYPPFPASVKDGYAVLASDNSRFRNVLAGVTTGIEPESIVVSGSCIRVSTGSMIPNGADAVIQVEDTAVAEKDDEGNEVKIEILKQPTKHQDIRAIGSDISAGALLIPSNTRISAAEIGVLSVYGIQSILTYQKPWIALLSTGDEVLEPNMPLRPGCIRDSNKSSLKYALVENRIPVVDVGIARDNAEDVKFHLMLAFESADVIISTGGVSMGEKDMLKQVLEYDFNAKIHFGRIHMKPGKPTTFSTVIYKGKKKLVFSLPGNPVSAFVCFYLFVFPCIKKLMGFSSPRHSVSKVKLNHDHKLDERPEFCRAAVNYGPDGVFSANMTGGQQSSRLSSMQNADVLLMLPPKSPEQQILKSGLLVDAIPLKTI
ncbi:gephyrin-like [Uloborus diversus]|uniref:gephyrin-like n=1 Tax=Uloborus diversus TaxID=327109 RepID=UPI00240A999B|nr:gephyrin-like [Uloborus diversus]